MCIRDSIIVVVNKNKTDTSTVRTEMGKKEQVPALAMFVQGSLWVWSATHTTANRFMNDVKLFV